ncbi:hypothetical protein [Paenibacillus sp. FSL K6-1230]|uniref:hypothetical protein n=1 Tax=Paenibacillus sp. FSL K6-1230 TaxID=2921603 RepID=UPI0030F8411E
MSTVKHDLVYVLINETTQEVEMATTNDSEAWAYYRDVHLVSMNIFLDMNRVGFLRGGQRS